MGKFCTGFTFFVKKEQNCLFIIPEALLFIQIINSRSLHPHPFIRRKEDQEITKRASLSRQFASMVYKGMDGMNILDFFVALKFILTFLYLFLYLLLGIQTHSFFFSLSPALPKLLIFFCPKDIRIIAFLGLLTSPGGSGYLQITE